MASSTSVAQCMHVLAGYWAKTGPGRVNGCTCLRSKGTLQ